MIVAKRMLQMQEWLDTQCRDTVSLATLSTWLHAWNQLEKVEFILDCDECCLYMATSWGS